MKEPRQPENADGKLLKADDPAALKAIRIVSPILARLTNNPMAAIQHHWATVFPQIPFSSFALKNFLIAECGQSADTAGEVPLAKVASLIKSFSDQSNLLPTARHGEIEIIARDLTPQESRIFKYLALHLNGVTFEEFFDYREPGSQRQLSQATSRENVERILRRMNPKLESHGWEISIGESSNLIIARQIG